MMDQAFILNLGIIVVAAALFGLGARRIKLPTIAAYLAAGLVLGPVFGIVEVEHPTLKTLSEAGIVLLLFLVGLELSLDKLHGMGRILLLAGLIQVGLTTLGGLAVSWGVGLPLGQALFLSIALTFSSTVVAVKLLEEKNEFSSLYGRVAVGILLFQDLVVILLLTVLAGYESGEGLDLRGVSGHLMRSVGGMAGLVLLVLGIARYLLPRPFAWAAQSPETLFIWSLCWCFFVVMAAHGLHLSAESGAFLAGLSLAQLPYNKDLRRRVHPLMNFFIAVFFVSLGIQMDLSALRGQWTAALAMTFFVLVGKYLIILWALVRLGFGARTSHMAGVTLSQISEFSFIFVALLFQAEWVDRSAVALVGLVGLVTISVSAVLITYSDPLYEGARRVGWFRLFRPRSQIKELTPDQPRRGHVIVVGMNTLGRELARRLHERGEVVLAIDTDPVKLAGLPCATLLGSAEYLSVLEEAHLASAKLLVSALRIEPTNDLLAYRCRMAGVPAAIHVVDLSVVDNLLAMDVDYMMIPKVDGMQLQTQQLKEKGFLEA